MFINKDICNETVALLNRDPAFIMSVKGALLESGLAELCGLIVDESKLDQFRPCPANWTAMQIAYFDNGEPAKKRNRPRIQKTRMRFGGNIKVWDRSDVRFGSDKQVAWQANFHLWTADQATKIVQELREDKLVGEEAVKAMADAISIGNPDVRYSIPMQKLPTGSRWMGDHMIMTVMQGDVPHKTILLFPERDPFATITFAKESANGEKLGGKAILQARVARLHDFELWATEIVK